MGESVSDWRRTVKLGQKSSGLTEARLGKEHTGIGKRTCAQKNLVPFHAIVALHFLLGQQKTLYQESWHFRESWNGECWFCKDFY